MNTELYVKFQTNFQVSAAIFDWGWAKAKIFSPFVGNSYTNKVTKAFPEIPSDYEAAAKRLPGGNFTP